MVVTKKAPDFTRAGHRIVQSTLLPFFCSTIGIGADIYTLSDGYITMKLNKRHFNCSAHEHLGSRHRRMQQPASTRGATICTISFCFGIARVLDHSLWYADKLVAQLNGCASSTSQAYAPMRRRRNNISQLPCSQKNMHHTRGGPFHSGAPRLCLTCLPCRDATAPGASVHSREPKARVVEVYSYFVSKRFINPKYTGTSLKQ